MSGCPQCARVNTLSSFISTKETSTGRWNEQVYALLSICSQVASNSKFRNLSLINTRVSRMNNIGATRLRTYLLTWCLLTDLLTYYVGLQVGSFHPMEIIYVCTYFECNVCNLHVCMTYNIQNTCMSALGGNRWMSPWIQGVNTSTSGLETGELIGHFYKSQTTSPCEIQQGCLSTVCLWVQSFWLFSYGNSYLGRILTPATAATKTTTTTTTTTTIIISLLLLLSTSTTTTTNVHCCKLL